MLTDLRREGYVRVRIDNQIYQLEEEIDLDKNKKHDIAVIVDRLIMRPGISERLTDSP